MSSDRVELETKYMFLEQTVSELNEVIYDQQKQIDQLRMKVEKMAARLDEMGGGGEDPLPHVKPPHY